VSSSEKPNCAVLFDTNFWIHLEEERRFQGRRGPAHTFLAEHRKDLLTISIITWGELAPGYPEPYSLDHFLRRIKIIKFDRNIAWEASRIERELRGQRLSENDNWIAATARRWSWPLVSSEPCFDRVRHLRRINY
jgi:predicted nucleic acid-binding protein